MMGGGFFDNIWDPYSGAYAYPRVQPRSRSYRPRAPVYENYGPSMVPENRASYKAEEPLNQKTAKTVKTIPVTDGGVPVAVPQKVSQLPVKKAVVARFESEDAAATKIQAVYRGYVVRKTQPLQHLRVIRKVKEELENLKGKLQETEQRKKLCSDSQEKLRWTEGVMALLLRLDSLQGVHPEVRLIRKAMTKELIGFQETIDSMSTVLEEWNGQDDVLTGENVDSSDVAEEGAEVIAAPEVVGEMGIDESASKELSGVEPDFASEGPVEEHCANDSNGEGMKGLVSESGSTEADAEVPMDVENKEQISTMSTAHRMEEGEVEPASQNLPPTAVESGDQEASGVDNSAVTASSRDDILSEGDAAVASARNNDDAEMRDEAHDVGRREDTELDMSQSGVNGVTGDNPDASARPEEKETTASEFTDGVDGSIIPASVATQSMCLDPQCVKSLQGGQPPQPDNMNALSDRGLLLQVLEENRKLKDVVGKVLEWGKQQSDVIHDLTHRIVQLEEHQPASNLLRGEDNNGRKRITNGASPVDNMGRSRQRLEKGRRNRRQRSYIDSEDWLSAESDEYF